MAKRRYSRKRQQKYSLPSLIVVILIGLVGWYLKGPNNQDQTTTTNTSSALTSSKVAAEAPTADGQTKTEANSAPSELAGLTYDQQQIIAVNDNQPTFSKSDLSLANGSWERYSDLDTLNRVGVANAMLGRDIMPTTERERLYIKPTGWHQRTIINNGHQDSLYNRCHLIGFQLTGQNNNAKNLMTGTRSLNDPGMTYYENTVAQYIRKTSHHVRYQIRPVFRGNDLVARGIQMMAQSVEDDKISFNVYIFNVQANYVINYATGTSSNA
ncbi:DNA/RNA non-specific endonuclease [Lapidilactobacillus bayanensis]|uniref:DNA/RNA non-specific endonuclease n=1 Tax=Lapidilactobacillus bayanensis TaxID=2485998 RepID=UPI000F79BB33|nr:DNA/RNA non-specific endonuclease [Lapidilactobacillus bayanensis]